MIFSRLFLICLAIALAAGLNGIQLPVLLQDLLSVLISISIVGLTAQTLWQKRESLHLVQQVYLKSGWLTYIRAFLIFVLTITVGTYAYFNVPGFMRWGWSSLIFGGTGNIVTQPFQVAERISQVPEAPASSPLVSPSPSPSASLKQSQSAPSQSPLPEQFDTTSPKLPTPPRQRLWLKALLIVPFWGLLVLVLPFWANLEERWFRQGVLAWGQIAKNSVLFGLMHLLAGIPLVWALNLAIPGFLFACRYKYVYHRCYKKLQSHYHADQAGVWACTADHAIYNAIIFTLLTVALLFQF
jgi:hypothetical protein